MAHGMHTQHTLKLSRLTLMFTLCPQILLVSLRRLLCPNTDPCYSQVYGTHGMHTQHTLKLSRLTLMFTLCPQILLVSLRRLLCPNTDPCYSQVYQTLSRLQMHRLLCVLEAPCISWSAR